VARLILDSLSKSYADGHLAVRDVSLVIEPGGFLALLGPSGCGKTTILRLIAGLEVPSSGTIRLGEAVLAGPGRFMPPEERNIAMVFQSYALWPHMSVADNIGYPLKIRGIDGSAYRKRVAAALEAVHMEGFGARRPAELSGGQRQLVALARCLVSEPALVLLDEPLANLDRHLRAAMEETFREFHRRTGATMIYVTHDQGEAMTLADRIAVMSSGRLLQVGTPETIYRQPETRAVADLIGQGAILSLPLTGPGRELDGEAIARALSQGRTGQGGVDVLVRPEDVVLGPAGCLEARVESCVFRGERYALGLVSREGARFPAYSATARESGETVFCTIRRAWRLSP